MVVFQSIIFRSEGARNTPFDADLYLLKMMPAKRQRALRFDCETRIRCSKRGRHAVCDDINLAALASNWQVKSVISQYNRPSCVSARKASTPSCGSIPDIVVTADCPIIQSKTVSTGSVPASVQRKEAEMSFPVPIKSRMRRFEQDPKLGATLCSG